jgi:hypothetical protein
MWFGVSRPIERPFIDQHVTISESGERFVTFTRHVYPPRPERPFLDACWWLMKQAARWFVFALLVMLAFQAVT